MPPKHTKSEIRSNGEIRAVDEEGIFEGYVTVWGTLDSYGSTFKRGAFTKTLQENGSKVKILWNHQQEVIGKALEIYEDDHGLFVRAQLIQSVQRGKETFELMKEKAIDGISFGFRAINEKFIEGVRNITEVALMEISPVIFPANQNALVTDVRAVDFSAMVSSAELNRKGSLLIYTLEDALWEAWWEDSPDEVVSSVNAILNSFTTAYSQWITEYFTNMAEDEERALPFRNDLAKEFHSAFGKTTLSEVASTTSLTISEARALRSGELIAARDKLNGLSTQLQDEFRKHRLVEVEKLFNELRDDFTDAEKQRLGNLLSVEEQPNEVVNFLTSFRQSLK